MTTIIIYYLIQIKNKQSHTWYLLGYFFSMLLLFIAAFLTVSSLLYPLDFYLQGITGLMAITGTIFLIKFAYAISGNTGRYRKRCHLVLAICILILLFAASASYLFVNSGDNLFLRILTLTVLSVSVICVVIYLIQIARVQTRLKTSIVPEREELKRIVILRQILGLILIPLLLISLLSIGVTFRIISQLMFNITAALMALFFIFSFALIYINHIEQQLSFMAKIVIISFVTILTIFSLIGYIMARPIRDSYNHERIFREPQTIQFIHQTNKYTVQQTTFRLEPEGEIIAMQEGRSEVKLDFVFPFFGENYSTIHIDYNGYIIPGETGGNTRIHRMMMPLVAPLSGKFDHTRGGKVFLKRDAGRITITWYELPELNRTAKSTFQTVLSQDGTILFSYAAVHQSKEYHEYDYYHMTGITPGGGTAHSEYIRFDTDLPLAGKPGTGIMENYSFQYYSYIHAAFRGLTVLVIIVCLFIMAIFPVFFRINLINPLKALINKIKSLPSEAKTDALPVIYHDEIGFLTESFNNMVVALREADKLKEVEFAYNKLKELDKAKTTFFANISHELRTPLTLISSPMESIIAGRYGKTVDCSSQVFKIIERNTNRLLGLIDSFLDFSKINSGRMHLKRTTVDVFEFIKFSRAQFENMARLKKIDFRIIPPSRIPLLLSLDMHLFETALINCLSNSFKFTPENGKITVELMETPSNFCCISISDTGIGIPRDKINHVFQRFYQVDDDVNRNYSGTGIGLFLVKEIIEQHGGKVTLESEPGQGTTISLLLPLDTQTIATRQPQPMLPENKKKEGLPDHGSAQPEFWAEDRAGTSSGRNVFIIEDNEDMLQYLSSMLEDEYRVFYARNGLDALEKIETIPRPDLFLVDVMMPLMDGREFQKIIKEKAEFRDVPFVFLTACQLLHEKIAGIESSALDYITKPFSLRELKAKIKSILSYKKGLYKNAEQAIQQKTLEQMESICEEYAVSKREKEVVQLLLQGKSRKEIAASLGIKAHTAKRHIENIYQKFKVHDRFELSALLKKDLRR